MIGSTMRHPMPRRASSIPVVRPMGPPPAIKTSASGYLTRDDYAGAQLATLRSMSNEAPGSSVHSGQLVARRLRASGIDTVFTLSGGHLFPIYDGCRTEGVRLIDTRHEQTAAFAAEGWSKVTRVPGVAALTAGPGVTNGMSAMAAAQQNQSPMLVLGGRAPAMRWGMGSLQEIDHVPFVAPLTRYAGTARHAGYGADDDRRRAASHRRRAVGRGVRRLPDGRCIRNRVRSRRGRRPARCTPCLAPTPQTGRRWRAQSSSSPRRSAR